MARYSGGVLATTCCVLLLLHGAMAFRHGRNIGNRHEQTFHNLASAAGLDKVIKAHSYHTLYDKYLPLYRHEAINFLEIGLGCTMAYGPGKSMAVWYQYFTHLNTTLDFMEIDAPCAAKFNHLSTRGSIIPGDQSKAMDLDKVVEHATSLGNYDIIVDDGGHQYQQQSLTFTKLWPTIRPGGILVTEDLETSYYEWYGGKQYGAETVGPNNTMVAMIKGMVDALNCQHSKVPCIPGLLSIDCFKEICVYVKE